ncbi:hypothetical protein ACFWHF_14475 [Streptomyces griseoincarnatus]
MPKITVHGGVSDRNRPEPAAAPETVNAPETAVEQPEVSRPALNDTKDAWVDYAVARGWSRDDAEASTKAQLVAQFKE